MPDDWDIYEGLQTLVAELYGMEYPEDPDVPELLKRRLEIDIVHPKRTTDALNWAMLVFRAPGDRAV